MFEDLYKTAAGRSIARVLASPAVSKAAGMFLSGALSKPLIKSFVSKNGINLDEAADSSFKSFNAFFTRKLKAGARPLGEGFVSPCDGLLSVYPIDEGRFFNIKGSLYTAGSLTNDLSLSEEFAGGLCLIFRLTPTHYHRYIFPTDGEIVAAGHINGIFHTVRPTALENVPVFKTNTREYALLDTAAYGRMLQMEVGATLVGKISNTVTSGAFKKGDEKGYFEFGGSTIVVMLKKGAVKLRGELMDMEEHPVLQGERLDL